jgi:hypothetical protein
MDVSNTSENGRFAALKREKTELRIPANEEEARTARKALFAYVLECEPATRGWEGELLDTDAVLDRFGIDAGKLNALRKAGQLICFGRSRRNRRYPAEQFTDDGQITTGIDRINQIVRSHSTAWLWLRHPCGPLNGSSPLDLLRSGEFERVLQAAHLRFDIDAGW